MCVCVCVYVCVGVCVCFLHMKYMYICAYMHVCIHVYMYACTWINASYKLFHRPIAVQPDDGSGCILWCSGKEKGLHSIFGGHWEWLFYCFNPCSRSQSLLQYTHGKVEAREGGREGGREGERGREGEEVEWACVKLNAHCQVVLM